MSCRTSTSARLFTTALLTALLAASVGPRSAEALPASDSRATFAEPRFHIQAIEVRGARDVSTRVVASQSLLRQGQVYTESELHDAVQRIRRLPFVLEADFALGKGRERGTYVLVVDIVETRRFFYQADVLQSYFGQPLNLEAGEALDHNLASTVTVGGRLFVGRYGLLFAAAGSDGPRIGYTRFNLFERGVTVQFGLARQTSDATSTAPLGLDPLLASWIEEGDADSATLTVGVPLGVHQAIRANVAWRQGNSGIRRPVLGSTDTQQDFRDRTEEEMRLAWTYDSTDDPVLPFEGTSLAIAVDYRTHEAELLGAAIGGERNSTEMSSDLLRLSVLGRRHWPLARRHSFAAGMSLAIGRSRVGLPGAGLPGVGQARESFDNWELTATIRHTLRFHEAKKAHSHRRFYWTNDLEYSWNALHPDRSLPHGPIEIASASSALVLRSAWGLLRLGLRWIHVGVLP